jgi:hypothetical protein
MNYDLTFIMSYPSAEENRIAEDEGRLVRRVALVGWHFGEYEFDVAEGIIQDWIDNGKKLEDICE